MLYLNSQRRLVVSVPVVSILATGALAVIASKPLLHKFSGGAIVWLLVFLAILLYLVAGSCVLFVEDDQLEIRRPFRRLSLPAAACDFSVVAKRGGRGTFYEIHVIGGGEAIWISSAFTDFGADRLAGKLQQALIANGQSLSPALRTEREARARQREIEGARAKKSLRIFLRIHLALLLGIAVLILAWQVWRALGGT
jgi:archaellum biogenesis protein FlaJ (TadC family)